MKYQENIVPAWEQNKGHFFANENTGIRILFVGNSITKHAPKEYISGGTDSALFDEQRKGRPVEITDDAKSWILNLACQNPHELGYSAELWTLSALHKHICANAEAAGYPRLATVTKPYIQKILRTSDIKHFKIKYYLEKRDPDFEQKMHDVLVVYKQVSLQFDENGNIIIPTDV